MFQVVVILVTSIVSFSASQKNASQCLAPMCNLAVCMQGTSSMTNANDILEALERGSFGRSCALNMGAIIYSDQLAHTQHCDIHPHKTGKSGLFERVKCLQELKTNVFSATAQENNLGSCLRHILTDKTGWWGFTHPNRCRYTLAIFANRDIADSQAVAEYVDQVNMIGVYIHCHLIGNPDLVPFDPYYKEMCDDITEYVDYDEVWDHIEDLYDSLHCCGEPHPPITTTSNRTAMSRTTMIEAILDTLYGLSDMIISYLDLLYPEKPTPG